jgi:phosphoglycolate phosphatase-like HAD superfamily hydrolase
MIRLVLFDIDGTLIRSGGAGVQAFERTFGEVFGLSDVTRSMQFSGRTDVSLVREAFRLHGIEASKINFDRFFATYPRFLEELLRNLPGCVLPGISSLLAEIEQRSKRPIKGLLTGNVRRGAELKLSHYQLWHRFETGAFADDDEDRNCIAAIAKKRGEELLGDTLSGEEILVIGDTPLDIACARAINAKVLAVSTGIHRRDELLAAKPTWAVEKVSDSNLDELLS